MIEQAKLLRVFTLIRLLKNRLGRTLNALAQQLDCSTRTIRRYLDLLAEIGYLVEEDTQGRRFIFEPEPNERPYLSPEETALLFPTKDPSPEPAMPALSPRSWRR